MTQKSPVECIAVISGHTGPVGAAYANAFARKEGTRVIGLTRRTESPGLQNVEDRLGVDLRVKDQVCRALEGLNIGNSKKVVFVHAVGCFKWEDSDASEGPIDPEVLAINHDAFFHVFDNLVDQTGRTNTLTGVFLGSISDPYVVPYWSSYSRANNMVARRLRAAVAASAERTIHGVCLQLGTLKLPGERTLRPNADEAYWVSIPDLIQRTEDHLALLPPAGGSSVYLETAHFERPEDANRYFSDPALIRARWLREMGPGKN